MRSTRRAIALISLTAGLLIAPPLQARLRVAATVPDLAALAAEVAGERAEVYSLTLPTQDPHFVDARPHLALKLSRADLLLVVGLQLEVGWLPTLLTGARNAKIQRGGEGYLDLSTVAALKEVPRQRVDRSMGDVHAGGNPHYLVDPQNARKVTQAIARRLAALDPAGAAAYRQNAARFSEALEQARRRWRAQLAAHADTPVVTFHKSWVYLTEALGLEVVAQLEPKPGIPPNPAHVLRVIRLMQRRQVPLLLQEEYYPDRTARLVAQKTAARLLVLPGGTRLDQGQRYLQRMDQLVRLIAGALNQRGGGQR